MVVANVQEHFARCLATWAMGLSFAQLIAAFFGVTDAELDSWQRFMTDVVDRDF